MSEEQPPPKRAEGSDEATAGEEARVAEDAVNAPPADEAAEAARAGEADADAGEAGAAHEAEAAPGEGAGAAAGDDELLNAGGDADEAALQSAPADGEHALDHEETRIHRPFRDRALVDDGGVALDEVVPGDGVNDLPADLEHAGLGDEHVPAEATEDRVEEVPPDPGSADAASPRMQSIVESLIFASDKPMTLKQLGDLLGETELARVRAAVAAVEQHYQTRGFQLHQVAGGFQFRTNPDNAQWVQKLLAQKPVKLSRAQIETLAIAAYRQPVTRPEIDEIRGVDSGGTLKTLLDRSLVRILGKKEEVGRPLLYGTTKEFLEFFNLADLKQLPTLREFHELSEEHQAQVAALEGVAPPGAIEAKEGEAVPDGPPPLTRLEITTPIEDEQELEEIDRLIRTAGVATDGDEPQAAEAAPAEEFEAEPTREFDAVPGEPTRVHHSTLQVPAELEHVDEEFDHSETTNKKKRPDGLDAHADDADDGGDESESDDEDEPEAG